MNKEEFKSFQEELIGQSFNNAPNHAREDLQGALDWAAETLRDHEGAGHSFHLHITKDGKFACSFSKPEWGGDHISRGMHEAPEAIVMAVCEYLNGV